MGLEEGKVIVITSGKGGVGKTTTTANLGIALARRGKKVVVMDTDTGLRNLDLRLGLENRVNKTLVDVVNGVPYRDALVRHKDKECSSLYLMPTAQIGDKSLVKPEQLVKLCEELKKDFDYILIDCPAGIEEGFKTAIAGADSAIIVTNPDMGALRDADKIIGELDRAGKNDVKFMVTRIRPHMVENSDMLSLEDIHEALSIDFIGQVPEDEKVLIADNLGKAVALMDDSPAGQAYRNIAGRILGDKIPFMTVAPKKGFFERLKRMFGVK